jgi:hypothetical protein
MAKNFLSPINLNKNEIQNARIQNLGSAPSSPVVGQVYFDTTLNKLGTYNGSGWDYMGVSSANGDVSSNTSSSVDGEMAVFSGTGGKTIKRSTLTGLLKAAAGVVSAAVAGTDYSTPTSSETLQNKSISGATNTFTLIPQSAVVSLQSDLTARELIANKSTSTSLGNSDTQYPTQNAVKTYVDNAVQGLSWKTAARSIALTNITLSGTQTVDGVALAAGDRVIVAGQTTGSQNGLYVVATGAWTRTTDADAGSELVNATAYVSEGTTYADTVWTVTTNAPVTIGTTTITWAQVNGGALPQATTATAGKVQLATQAEAEAKSDSSKAVVPSDLVNFTLKKSFNVGDGTATSYALTHNLGTRDVIVAVYDTTTFAVVECDITYTSTSTVTLGFGAAPASNAYRAVIQG